MNYTLLKPYHVQQIHHDASSLVSVLMILNSIRIKPITLHLPTPITQNDFYALIKKDEFLYNWFLKTYGMTRPDTKNSFINLHQFSRFTSYLFDWLNIPAKVSKRYRKSTSYDQFLNDMKTCEISNCTFMIMECDKSYAPFGKLLDNVEFILLDPDYEGLYGKEYHYKVGQGEYILPCVEFYDQVDNGSGYLLIDLY